jgi:excisionase family DNA binding protein
LGFFPTLPVARNGKLPRMTKITIPTGNTSVITIPEKSAQPEPQPIERIGVSVEIAAEMLDVSVRTMWNLAKEGKIRTVRTGARRVIFSVQSIKEFVNGKENHCQHQCSPADKSSTACVAGGKESN